ncbi:MAG: hypothetical protein CM15mP126_1190 [Gammaproteobacteria bacterium]|nr:MAG: hypothetical protein CM15mP126_1190 [Gammaproteobacteria bacterium]
MLKVLTNLMNFTKDEYEIAKKSGVRIAVLNLKKIFPNES